MDHRVGQRKGRSAILNDKRHAPERNLTPAYTDSLRETPSIVRRRLFFTDRSDAGRRLAAALAELDADGVGAGALLVLGLPRGGVPVAAAVARRLAAPLHVLVARKLGAPEQPELAIGAIAEAGARFVDDELVQRCDVDSTSLDAIERRERQCLGTQVLEFDVARRPSLVGRDVIVVDDGLATGATARAACRAARSLGAARVTLAVPGAPTDWRTRLAGEADRFVCVGEEDVPAVGCWYADFAQVGDAEVRSLLAATGV